MPLRNPVIPGFYPDPSICRVGDDYFLVTSSFEYFPGVPLFHSRDLVEWTQIGHCLTRQSQLPLHRVRSSGGIYAPTIRYHGGKFYMVTTHVDHGGNFIVVTDDPYGAWSEPIWLDQGGIDPSLCFDDDGSVYLTSNGSPSGIYQSRIDPNIGARLSDTRLIWHGTGGRYPEAPHLYHIGGWYYLMIAEGGTEYGHMETLARSRSPWGPFESCPLNPILSHRDRGGHPIQGTGHADLVQAADGRWWAVFLAFRPTGQYSTFHHLGRETFLAPVTWTPDGWFQIGQGGHIELDSEESPAAVPNSVLLLAQRRESFDRSDGILPPEWCFLRNPDPDSWSLTARPGYLRLHGSALTLNEVDSPAFVGRRQQHFECQVTALLDFEPEQDGEEAGLTALMNEQHHYELAVTRLAGIRHILARRRIGDLAAVVAQSPLEVGPIILEITATKDQYEFAYRMGVTDDVPRSALATGVTRYLSSEVAGGFTGVFLGMYATGNGGTCIAPADFDWFEYRAIG